jgi:hypothetical protein
MTETQVEVVVEVEIEVKGSFSHSHRHKHRHRVKTNLQFIATGTWSGVEEDDSSDLAEQREEQLSLPLLRAQLRWK